MLSCLRIWRTLLPFNGPELRCRAGPLGKRQRLDSAATQRHDACPSQNQRPGADCAAPRKKTAEELEDEEIMAQLSARGIYDDSPPDEALDAAAHGHCISSVVQPSQSPFRTAAARAPLRPKTAEELEDEEIMRMLAERGIYDSQPEVNIGCLSGAANASRAPDMAWRLACLGQILCRLKSSSSSWFIRSATLFRAPGDTRSSNA